MKRNKINLSERGGSLLGMMFQFPSSYFLILNGKRRKKGEVYLFIMNNKYNKYKLTMKIGNI